MSNEQDIRLTIAHKRKEKVLRGLVQAKSILELTPMGTIYPQTQEIENLNNLITKVEESFVWNYAPREM